MEAEGSTGIENSANGAVGTTNKGGGAYAFYGGDSEVLKSVGLAHLLVLFWTRDLVVKSDEAGHRYYELRMDPEKYEIIGCDEGEETRQLLLYRDFAASTPIRSYRYYGAPKGEGVIGRVYRNRSPEMNPNIRYYSEDEYPHQSFALSCGIRSSFCFPFSGDVDRGVMEIVSTRNQDAGALRKLCESFEGLDWEGAFRDLSDVRKYEIPEMDHLLKVVCQKLRLPLTQYQTLDEYMLFTLVNQFSYSDFESLEPWCQLKDACFHMQSGDDEGLLGTSWGEEAFFCMDVTALSITEYPFAHYARNCRSFSCFIIHLDYTSSLHGKYVLLFFLPAQEMDNFYLQSLLNSIWELIKEYLPNCKLASGKQLGQVLSVKVIKSSFKIGQHDNSLPHREGFRHTHTLDLFENGTTQRIPIEACQPGKSKKCLEIKGNTVAAEGVDNFVEVSSDEVVKYDVIPASKRLKKSKIPFTAENIRMHFGEPQKDAAERFGVSLSTFKRRCRALNIEWWEPGKSKRISSEPGGERNSSGMSNLPIRLVTHASQEINTMTVKVTCNNDNIRFELPSSSGIAELNNSVIERLPLDGKSFSLKYQDDEGDWIVIACDKDVQECIKISRLLKKTTIKMLLGPLISNYAL